MIRFLSYVIAVIITVSLAIILYPIAGIFWVVGLFGKMSNIIFSFTKKTISKLWQDLRNQGNQDMALLSGNIWKCKCGATNTGKFCTECGFQNVENND